MKKHQEPKTVFYVRLSKSKRKRDQEGRTLEEIDYDNQIQILKARWGEHEVVTERVSGGKPRKVLFDLITSLPKGSTIHAVHLDRLSRQGAFNLGWLIEIARQRTITVHTVHDGNLTTMSEEDEIFVALKAYTADKERRETARRMRDHIAARALAGLKWGNQIALERGTFRPRTPDPFWASALPRLKELRDMGHTYREIVEIATREFGEQFSKTQVYRLLNERRA